MLQTCSGLRGWCGEKFQEQGIELKSNGHFFRRYRGSAVKGIKSYDLLEPYKVRLEPFKNAFEVKTIEPLEHFWNPDFLSCDKHISSCLIIYKALSRKQTLINCQMSYLLVTWVQTFLHLVLLMTWIQTFSHLFLLMTWTQDFSHPVLLMTWSQAFPVPEPWDFLLLKSYSIYGILLKQHYHSKTSLFLYLSIL